MCYNANIRLNYAQFRAWFTTNADKIFPATMLYLASSLVSLSLAWNGLEANGNGVVSNVVIRNVRLSDAVKRADTNKMAGETNADRCNKGEALDADGNHVRAHQVPMLLP